MLDVRSRRAPAISATAWALVAWSALVVVAVVWGRVLVATGAKLDLAAPPFWSPLHVHVTLRVVPAIACATVITRFGRELAQTLRWSRMMLATAASAIAWALTVAYVDGAAALTDPVRFSRNDYLQTARSIGSIHTFLSQFVPNIAGYPQHTKGHPPGMVVIEWMLDKAGLTSAGWNAALVIAGGAAAAVAVLVALREVAGEPAARVAAPFVVLAPAVITWQTADAFFAGVSAWAITMLVLASGRREPRADAYAVAGGLLFGVTAFLSYGLVVLAVLPIVVCVARRRLRPLVVAAIATLPVFAFFAALGFSWFSGFAVTRHEYWTGVAIHRPYTYFLVADLALFAIMTGPAVAIALTRLRDRNVWLLVGGILAVVALADLSGMSKAEVERIWLPFVPWALLATAAFVANRRAQRTFLAMQAACTLIVAVTIWSQW